MSLHLTTLLNLSGVVVESWDNYENSVYFHLSIIATGIYCPYCRIYTEELHQIRPIIVRDLPAFGKEVYLKLPRRQFYCRCCQRYITEVLEFIDWRRKYTRRYEESIYQQVNYSSIEEVSRTHNLTVIQVKNIFNHVKKTSESIRN